jgi:hypothetical protein
VRRALLTCPPRRKDESARDFDQRRRAIEQRIGVFVERARREAFALLDAATAAYLAAKEDT